jgi:putative hydrolase of the HAD superfamily
VAGTLGRVTFRAVVFDLFGTLVPEFDRDAFHGAVREMADIVGADRERFLEAWNATAVDRQTGMFRTVEANVRSICAELAVSPPDEAIERALDARLALYRTMFHPRVGAMEMLRAVKERSYDTALVSMCAPDAPAMWRASEMAPYIDVEVFSSEVGLRKPDPMIYQVATDGLGVEPEACLYVGDGAYGELRGATEVGMAAYLIADPVVDPVRSLTPEREDWSGPVVADLRDLLALLPDRR